MYMAQTTCTCICTYFLIYNIHLICKSNYNKISQHSQVCKNFIKIYYQYPKTDYKEASLE